MQIYARREHKKEKIIVITVMAISVIIIGVLGYLYYLDIKSRPLITYPVYSLSTSEWTSGNVIITVDNSSGNISSYSFDGGVNYQDENTYEVLTNGEFQLIVKDINGRESKIVPIAVRNIDKDDPIISFENNTTVELNSSFNLRTGVTVSDGDGSGLSSTYVVTPSTIDTSVPGTYTVTYTVFDKVGNYTEKTRTVTVSSVTGKTYYRYRTSTIESYQCDSYMCNCVESETATLNQSCPAGYSFNDSGACCQTCYKTCKRTVWSEWSNWSLNKVTPSSSREVETKVE